MRVESKGYKVLKDPKDLNDFKDLITLKQFCYTKCAMSSSRSPGSMSITGSSTIV